jgi:hypothetical protein
VRGSLDSLEMGTIILSSMKNCKARPKIVVYNDMGYDARGSS